MLEILHTCFFFTLQLVLQYVYKYVYIYGNLNIYIYINILLYTYNIYIYIYAHFWHKIKVLNHPTPRYPTKCTILAARHVKDAAKTLGFFGGDFVWQIGNHGVDH